MKKKKFKPVVKSMLENITIFLGIMILSVNDMNAWGFILLGALIAIVALNIYLLDKYS